MLKRTLASKEKQNPSQSLCKLLRRIMTSIFRSLFLVWSFVGRNKTILFPGSRPNPVHSETGGWQADVCSPLSCGSAYQAGWGPARVTLHLKCLNSEPGVPAEWQGRPSSLRGFRQRQEERRCWLPDLSWASILVTPRVGTSMCDLESEPLPTAMRPNRHEEEGFQGFFRIEQTIMDLKQVVTPSTEARPLTNMNTQQHQHTDM